MFDGEGVDRWKFIRMQRANRLFNVLIACSGRFEQHTKLWFVLDCTLSAVHTLDL
jgi:hypothetical protein